MLLNNNHHSPAKGLTVHFSYVIVFFFILILFSGGHTIFAQSSNLSDYVVLAGDPSCAATSDCGAKIQNEVSISGGIVGSYTDVKVGKKSDITGELYSGETIELEHSVNIGSNCYAANLSGAPGNAITGDYSVFINGNIIGNGDIQIVSGTVVGSVTHPPANSYSGPSPAGGIQLTVPGFNSLPSFPQPTVIPPSGTTDITNTATITPGAYDLLKLTGGMTLTLSGTGDYVFDKIKTWGSFNKIIFDFQNNPGGEIKILVHNDVSLGATKIEVINGGSANRIYLETHDNSGTSAFKIKGGDFGNGESSTWLGTVYAPYQSIKLG
jgi:hypothetical protein